MKLLVNKNSAVARVGRKKKSLIALASVLVLLAAFAAGNAYGKYVQGLQKTGVVAGKEFYFESDFLDAASANKTYTVYPGGGGTASVTFQLHNFIDDLRVSDVDMTFAVKAYDVTGGVQTEMPSLIEAYTNTLDGEAKNSQAVTVSNLAAGKTYLITVTGSGGYVKTIQARFVVAPLNQNVYKYVKVQGEEVLLTVWTENVIGTATISIREDGGLRSKLIPDNTDPALDSVAQGQAVITDQDNSFGSPYASHMYRFFNPEHVDCDVNDFTVVVGTTTAVPGTP